MQGRKSCSGPTIAFGKRAGAFSAAVIFTSVTIISYSLVACSTYQLRDPTDLNAKLIPFSKVKDGTVAGCKYAADETSCEMSDEIALAPPKRLEVTALVIGPKGHNEVLPGISNWQWDLPGSDRKLESLSRSDLLALNFFRLASVPADVDDACEAAGHNADLCKQENVIDWWAKVGVTKETKVETVFGHPTLHLHISNGVRAVNEPEAPLTTEQLCAGVSQSAGAPWNVAKEADTDASRTHAIQFFATGTDTRRFYVFQGSNWIFSGDLHAVSREFDNGWTNLPAVGARYYGRSDVSVTIPIDTRGLPIADHVPLCTTIQDVAAALHERGYELKAVSRECKALPGDFLHIQRKSGSFSGKAAYQVLDVDARQRAKELALVCPGNSKRLMLRFVPPDKGHIVAGEIDLADSARASLLVAENDAFVADAIK